MTLAEVRIWDDAPSILIFADRPSNCAEAAAVACGIGARVIGSDDLVAALPRLSQQAAVDAVMFELDEWSGGIDPILDWANDAAISGYAVPVISFPRTMIDRVAAHVPAAAAELLCAPTMEDRIASLAFSMANRFHRLQDHGLEASAERLRRLSQEVARIAKTLSEMSSGAFPPLPRFEGPADGAPAPETSAHAVRMLIRLRRLRAQFFPDYLFADPAWDMLLDLMAARLEEERVAVSSLCIAAAVPPTTALRWIRTMTDQGIFVRRHDPDDGRRIFIDLSDDAARAMAAFFHQAQALGWRPA